VEDHDAIGSGKSKMCFVSLSKR